MKLRHCLLALLIIFILAAGFLYSAFDTPWLSVRLAKKAAAETIKGASLTKIKISRQHFTLPGELVFEGVDLVFSYNERQLKLDIPRVRLTGLQSLLSGDPRFLVTLAEGEIVFAPGEAHRVAAELAVSKVSDKRFAVSGPVTMASAAWGVLKAEDVSFFLATVENGLELRAIKAQAYGGSLAGKALVSFKSSYESEVFLDGVSTEELGDVNSQIPLQLGGKVSGRVEIAGSENRITSLSTELGMPSGGEMSASLLGALTQYIPQSREKKRLDALIKSGGKLAVEVLSFSMKSDSPRHLSGEVHVYSREIKALAEFGLFIGQAFQIQDDIIGIFESEDTIGKSILSDLEERKKTILMVHAYRVLKGKKKAEFLRIFNKPKKNLSDLEAMKEILVESGSLEYALKAVRTRVAKAHAILEKLTMQKTYRDLIAQSLFKLFKQSENVSSQQS